MCPQMFAFEELLPGWDITERDVLREGKALVRQKVLNDQKPKKGTLKITDI